MKPLLFSTVTALSLTSALCADMDFTLFGDTKFNGELRPRYENVDVDNSGKDQANAYTIRATLGLESTLLGIDALSMKVDGTTVQTIGAEHYNDLSSDARTAYEVVADPEQSRFTQAYLQYRYGATTLKAGRQIINLDNQRFIGSVDWRQMPQSFDAVTIHNTSVPGLDLTGAYVYSYATVFDEPTWKSTSLLLNGSYTVNEQLKVTLYDYMISSEKGTYGSDTYGLALSGKIPVAGAKIDYRAEYARQDDATYKTVGSAKQENDARYYDLEVLANISGVLAGAGYEFLSGTNTHDGKSTFSTPLATLHKFNGWADKFLVTPTGGLVDTSASLGYTTKGFGKAMIIYHDFQTDEAMSGKSDLGSEWDVMYANAIPGLKGLNGLVKAAYYNAGDVTGFTKDARKIWLQLDYKF